MPNHPAPRIANHLALVQQPLASSEWSHVAQVNVALLINNTDTAQDVADNWQTQFNSEIMPLLTNVFTGLKATVLLGDGTNAPAFAVAGGATATGGRNISSLPPNVSGVLKKTTGLAGRKNRGRNFLPGWFSEGEVSDAGVISGTQVANMSAALLSVLTNLGLDGYDVVIANKTLVDDPVTGKPYVTDIFHSTPVLTWVAEPVVGTQRRRLVRQ